jgi:protein involved in polysaccharide export with SLBB domain
MRFLSPLFLSTFVLSLASCVSSTRISDDPTMLKPYRHDTLRGVFTVKGSVYRPGTFTITPFKPVTLADALKRAGGTIPGDSFDNGASLDDIRVLRVEGDAVVAYKLDVRHGTDRRNFQIKAGDQIYVPEVTF